MSTEPVTDADQKKWRVGLVGYGEVGRIVAEDLRRQNVAVAAYDTKLGSRDAGPLVRHAAGCGVQLAKSHAELAANADLIISAVTASETIAAAEACSPAVRRNAGFADFNSASPGTKQRAGEIVECAGGRYVEAAVMASFPPYRLKVPMLLGGPSAHDLMSVLNGLGFDACVASDRLGVASAIKMCRSVMIKGLEALVIESFTTARHYGVEEAVIASLVETFPGIEWERQGAYFFQRAIEHGRRRAEEMREAALTVREAGLAPLSTGGTAQRHEWAADLAAAGIFGRRGEEGFARAEDWRSEADRILAEIKRH